MNNWYNQGILTWQQEVNSGGGINGRKIVLTKVDNMLTADGAIAACKETTSNGSFMVLSLTVLTSEDDCEDAAGLPVFDNVPSYMKPWHSVLISHFGVFFAPIEASFLKSSYMNAATKKIGIVYSGDNPTYVADYHAIVDELKKQGLHFVHAEQTTSTETSAVSQMSRMQASGAETVMLYTGIEGAGVVRDAKAIGYAPQWYAAPDSFPNGDVGAKQGTASFQGMFGLRQYTTTETPGFKNYVAKVRKYQGDSAANSADDVGADFYGLADTLGKMLALAGTGLSRQSFLTAARTIDNYQNGVTVPFGLKGRAVPVGQWSLFPIKCCKADYTWMSLGPPQERF